jgi:hypothetical protein
VPIQSHRWFLTNTAFAGAADLSSWHFLDEL